MDLQANEPLVEALDLVISYAGRDGRSNRVVDGVSFTIGRNDTLGIVGESGSGKSTLARALLGYLRAGSVFDGGSLRLRQTDLVRADRSGLDGLRGREVAIVPQNPLAALTHHRQVGWQVEEVLRTRAGLSQQQAKVKALALFDEMGLPDPALIARRFPHQLSGGQRQRVVIAAALACDPDLLVLDEPTTALDKSTESQVLELIMRLRATRRSSLVLVTHDLSVVARICERVLVMQDGRIVEEGRVGEVFSHPKTDYARLLLSASLDIGRTAPVRPLEQAPSLLEARGLQYSYRSAGLLPRLSRAPARPAFTDVAFSLGRGEVLGVIGESGSGKTTLALTVAGLMRPSGGTLEFDGRSIASISKHRAPELRRRIQMVFQDPLSSLNPRHTVGHAIARPLELYFGLSRRAALQRAAQHLAELGMTADLLERFPRQLSGGQQQRVAIARAFAVEPDLLICDEITSALDAAVQAQVLDLLLAQQQHRRTAMLLVTHDLSVIWKMAARVIVLKDGGIVEQGITSQVFGNPSDAYTRSLLDAALAVTAMTPGQDAPLTHQTMENRDAH